MDLAKQVDDLLQRAAFGQSTAVQASKIAAASRLFDDLAARGLVEPPSYRLAPLNAIPPKAQAFLGSKVPQKFV